MPLTSRLALRSPYGVLKAPTSAGGTTTTFLTTNANAAGIAIGNVLKVYALASGIHTLRGDAVTITNKQADVPGAGTTTFTFTPALGTATVAADQIYDPEIVDISSWVAAPMAIIDKALGAKMCTSTTRPTGTDRFLDMLIVERDTQDMRRWTGATWELISNPRRARGRLGYASSNAAGPNTAQNVQTGPYLSITWNQVQSQWHEVFFSCNVAFDTGTDNEAFGVIRRGVGGIVTGSDPVVGRFTADGNGVGASINVRGATAFSGDLSGQRTIGLFLDRTGMTSASIMNWAANCFNMMSLMDVGT